MATSTASLYAAFTSDAQYRTWGSGFAAQLDAVGLVQTADTGQINWASVTRPSEAGNAGYEIWRLDDTLQATKPVFIKINYGMSGGTDGGPAMKLGVGTITDGAGTLSGQTGGSLLSSDFESRNAGGKTGGTSLNSYVCGGTNGFVFCSNLDPATNGFALVGGIERSHDDAGDDTGDFVTVHMGGFFQVVPFAGTIPGKETSWPCLLPADDSVTHVFSGDTYVLPHRPVWYKEFPPSRHLFSYKHAELTELADVTIEHYGADHNYLPLGNGYRQGSVAAGREGRVGWVGAAPYSLCMLWE